MGLVHLLSAYAKGSLTGTQLAQRDHSPFVVHFTSWTAMAPLRRVLSDSRTPRETASLLDTADAASWDVAQKIIASRKLLATSPDREHGLPACVCFSECTLPGLMSHCERYGRFGFAVHKHDLYRAGGRPCLYLGEEEYGFVAEQGRGAGIHTPAGRLFALSNVYVPPRTTNKIQDFTHEREWRLFGDFELSNSSLAALLAPSRYVAELARLHTGVPTFPVDLLFDWGA